MAEHTSDVIEKVLREAVPTASDNQVDHQMEYLDARLDEGGYLLCGSGNDAPTYLHAFYGRGDELTPKLQRALDLHYAEVSRHLVQRVTKAVETLAAQKVPADSLWLPASKEYPLRGGFLGLDVRRHKSEEEFVMSWTFGRVVGLETDVVYGMARSKRVAMLLSR